MSEFRKQHPVAGISQVLDTIKQNFVTLFILLFIGSTNSEGYFLYFLAFGIGVSLIGGIFGWWFFKYRVIEDELQIEKGIFVKKKVYMSKDSIQVIDVTEGLLQRLFGLVKLEVKTAGGGTETATISAITREEAEELRTELRKKADDKNSAEVLSEAEEDQSEKIISEWKLPSKDLVYAAFTSGNFGLIASILGAVSGQLGELINEETIDYIYEVMPGFSNVTIYIALILGIIIISWFLSFLGVIFSYTDFHLKKTEKELIISRGLIEKKQITVPFDRIQAVRFVEGLLRQPFGFGMIYVESAGFDQTQQGRSIVLAPFISAKKLTPFLNEYLSDYSEPEFSLRPKKKAFLRYLRRPNYFLIILVPILWYLLTYGWMSLIMIPVLSVLGWLRYKDAAIGNDEGMLRMRYRTISRTTAIAKRNRIQNIELAENPFQRRKKLRDVMATVASGSGGMQFEVKDLNVEGALDLYEWLLSSDSEAVSEDQEQGPREDGINQDQR